MLRMKRFGFHRQIHTPKQNKTKINQPFIGFAIKALQCKTMAVRQVTAKEQYNNEK